MCGAFATRLARGVEDRAREIEPLLDVDRTRGVPQHRAHLLRDVHEQRIEHFETHRVRFSDGSVQPASCREPPPADPGSSNPPSATSPAQPGAIQLVAPSSQSSNGPCRRMPGRGRGARTTGTARAVAVDPYLGARGWRHRGYRMQRRGAGDACRCRRCHTLDRFGHDRADDQRCRRGRQSHTAAGAPRRKPRAALPPAATAARSWCPSPRAARARWYVASIRAASMPWRSSSSTRIGFERAQGLQAAPGVPRHRARLRPCAGGSRADWSGRCRTRTARPRADAAGPRQRRAAPQPRRHAGPRRRQTRGGRSVQGLRRGAAPVRGSRWPCAQRQPAGTLQPATRRCTRAPIRCGRRRPARRVARVTRTDRSARSPSGPKTRGKRSGGIRPSTTLQSVIVAGPLRR